ncbi:conserved exported hypothetical protein [Flavobacterium sp. 9AF]|uniref:hypothetical protein n=1 Tax=Flavobacterium sp. 9AF TaxID=2653142 RepID=UPI0012F25AC7|nr:hypothetical protein [Flavobacterium sp. 9AF]VXB18741.1 conserved exported hypothetical protein [Flavobacterium sp. 9AF]
MIKKFIVCLTLLSGVLAFSQRNTYSPYSYYGLGEVKFRGTQNARAMGGLGIEGDSISLNLLNPASYSHLKLTSFAVGATTSFANLINESNTSKAKSTNLDYLAIGIPMGKFGASFGLIPYSAVGYNVSNVGEDEFGNQTIKTYTGTGNINRFFAGVSYSINKDLSIGADFQYNFGNIETQTIEGISTVQLLTREKNSSQISGTSFNFGALYNKKISDKYHLYTSLTYSPEANLTSKNQRNLATVGYTANGAEVIYNNPLDIPVGNTTQTIPSKFAFGLGVGEKNKWMIGSEITFRNTSSLTNRFEDYTSGTYENSQKYSIGGYYIPKYDSFSSYLERVVYRAGFRYENTGLIVKEKSIKDYGMNFGFGLPLGYSKIDLGLEYGVRGTKYNNLIRENYFNISVGLSLSDKWFKKRKID